MIAACVKHHVSGVAQKLVNVMALGNVCLHLRVVLSDMEGTSTARMTFARIRRQTAAKRKSEMPRY